jgi:hypothetical protein
MHSPLHHAVGVGHEGPSEEDEEEDEADEEDQGEGHDYLDNEHTPTLFAARSRVGSWECSWGAQHGHNKVDLDTETQHIQNLITSSNVHEDLTADAAQACASAKLCRETLLNFVMTETDIPQTDIPTTVPAYPSVDQPGVPVLPDAYTVPVPGLPRGLGRTHLLVQRHKYNNDRESAALLRGTNVAPPPYCFGAMYVSKAEAIMALKLSTRPGRAPRVLWKNNSALNQPVVHVCHHTVKQGNFNKHHHKNKYADALPWPTHAAYADLVWTEEDGNLSKCPFLTTMQYMTLEMVRFALPNLFRPT